MKKLALLLSLLALAVFGVAACGDDEEADTTAAETTTEETTTEEAAGGGGGGTVAVSADPDGGLAYEQSSLEATAGPNTIEFTNDSSTPHDVVIEDADANEIARTDQISGDTTTADAELAAGEYTFYCSVPGHRDAGMEGPLTVE